VKRDKEAATSVRQKGRRRRGGASKGAKRDGGPAEAEAAAWGRKGPITSGARGGATASRRSKRARHAE
jgi:hypothetical protein